MTNKTSKKRGEIYESIAKLNVGDSLSVGFRKWRESGSGMKTEPHAISALKLFKDMKFSIHRINDAHIWAIQRVQ